MGSIKKRPAIEASPSDGRFRIRLHSNNIDELGQAVKAWDVDFRQVAHGPFRGDLIQVGLGQVQLARARLRGRVHQRGSTPREFRTFAIPNLRRIRLFWRGHDIGSDQILVFPRGGELECASHPDFDMLTVSVVEDELDAAAERLQLPSLEKMRAGKEVISCDRALLSQARRWIRLALREAPPAIPESSAERTAEMLLKLVASSPTALVPGIPLAEARPAELPERQVRETAMHRALEFIDRAGPRPLSVTEVCRAAGCSERTLRRAFHGRFGVGPKTYLLSQRLAGVRRDLRNSETEPTVIADVANEWGFWHMGQFASDFRRFFGELPSESLRR